MAVNALQYIKNVGKSFGYSAIDAFKEYNPQVVTLASGAKEFGSELYHSIKDFKASMIDTGEEKGLMSKGKDIVSEYRTNLFEDLKSGNWYNRQRISAAEDNAIGEMFGFDDDDFNLDDLDFDFDDSFDDEEDSSESNLNDTAVLVETQKKSTDAVISAMDAVGSKSASAISTATVQSADYIVTSNRQSSKALYSLNQRGFHQVSTGLAAINANISSLITLGEPLTTHMQNSATFYTQTAEYQKSVLEKLDTIIKHLTPEENNTNTRKEGTMSSILNDGVIDLPAYFDMVKTNMKNFKDEMMGFVDMFGGPEAVIKMATASPLKLATDGLTKLAIPKMMQSTMQSFNKSLEGFFGAAIDKLEHTHFDGLFGDVFDFIKGSLLPKSGFKRNIDPGNYTKGKVDWSGTSKKALEEVIPTYLAEMTSALTGGPVTRFNYKNGKFETVKGIKNANDQRMKRAAESAGGDFRSDAIAVSKNMGLSPEEQKAMGERIETFFLKAFEKGKEFTSINEADFKYQDFGLDEESLKVLRDVLKSYGKLGGTKRATRFASEVRLGRDRYGDETRALEADYLDPITALYNNSSVLSKGDKNNKVRAGGLLGLDQYNHDIFFYLQGIYQYTGHLSDNIGIIGGYSGKGKKRDKKAS